MYNIVGKPFYISIAHVRSLVIYNVEQYLMVLHIGKRYLYLWIKAPFLLPTKKCESLVIAIKLCLDWFIAIFRQTNINILHKNTITFNVLLQLSYNGILNRNIFMHLLFFLLKVFGMIWKITGSRLSGQWTR
jgi:hypothetical protein